MIHPDLKQATINPRKEYLSELEAGEFFYNEDKHVCIVLRTVFDDTSHDKHAYVHNFTTGINEKLGNLPGQQFRLAKITIIHELVPVDEKENK